MTREYHQYLLDLLGQVAPVSGRRMFGGYGYFCDGLMFALAADNVLYLKVDDSTEEAFEQRALAPFCYQRAGKRCCLRYRRTPDELHDDPEVLSQWVGSAIQVARRAAR